LANGSGGLLTDADGPLADGRRPLLADTDTAVRQTNGGIIGSVRSCQSSAWRERPHGVSGVSSRDGCRAGDDGSARALIAERSCRLSDNRALVRSSEGSDIRAGCPAERRAEIRIGPGGPCAGSAEARCAARICCAGAII